MTVELVRPVAFDFPPPVKPLGGLLDIAQVLDAGWLGEPQGLVESYNCLILDSVAVWPCPEPALVAAPVLTGSSTATTGGTLPADTYRAKITLVNSNGETVASNEVSQATTGATSTVTWTYAAAPAGSSYRIYITDGAVDTEVYAGPAGGTSYVLSAPPPAGGAAPPDTGTANVTTTKTFSSPAWQDGIRFGVYGGITCKGPGFDTSEAEAKTLAAFLANESVGVERALMTTRFTTPAATDLTPASGPVSAAVGLAILEGDAGCNYAGRPIIHMPRQVASLLSGVQGSISREGDHLETKLGSLVAAGGGYGCPNTGPTGAAPAAGEFWLYASGAVYVTRTDVALVSDIDRSTNDVFVLAERAYIAVVDCYVSAVRVEVFA